MISNKIKELKKRNKSLIKNSSWLIIVTPSFGWVPTRITTTPKLLNTTDNINMKIN